MAGPIVTTEHHEPRDARPARAETPTVPEREKRYIYSGDTPRKSPPYAMRPNRRAVRRKLSTFNLIALLLMSGLVIVVYVNNVIAINRLSTRIGELEKTLLEVQNRNEMLRAEVSKKAGRERIGTIAGEQLGLIHAKEPPVPIGIDEEKHHELTGR